MRATIALGWMVAGALTVGLTACAADPPVAEPTDLNSPSAAPTPDTAAAEVVLTTDSLDVLDAAGNVLDSVGFFGDPTDTVTMLTTAFGAEPDIAAHEPEHSEDGTGTSYRWGGFEFRVYDRGSESNDSNQVVVLSDAGYGDLSYGTVGDLRVGDPFADLEALDPVPYPYNEGIPTHAFYYVDVTVMGPCRRSGERRRGPEELGRRACERGQHRAAARPGRELRRLSRPRSVVLGEAEVDAAVRGVEPA